MSWKGGSGGGVYSFEFRRSRVSVSWYTNKSNVGQIA